MVIPLLLSGVYFCVNYVFSLNQKKLKVLYETNQSYKFFVDTFKKLHNFGLMIFSIYVAYSFFIILNPTYLVLIDISTISSFNIENKENVLNTNYEN